jgi:nucleoside-diphosphate-sugar epimerase
MILITGSEGNIGQKLMHALPDTVGVDRKPTATIVADLETVDYSSGPLADALQAADALIHLATDPDPEAPPEVHLAAAVAGARLVGVAARIGVPRLLLASSDWADPKMPELEVNPYGRSKRVFEELARLYDALPGLSGAALRIGWIPEDPLEVENAPDWLEANHWPDETLITTVRNALGL